MKRIALTLAILAAAGCCEPKVITVPPPTPPRIQRPALRVKTLPPTATTAQVLEAYVLDLADQVGYADQLEVLIYGPGSGK